MMTARLRAALPAEVVRALADHPVRRTAGGDAARLVAPGADGEPDVAAPVLRRAAARPGRGRRAQGRDARPRCTARTRCWRPPGSTWTGVSPTKLKEAVVDHLERAGSAAGQASPAEERPALGGCAGAGAGCITRSPRRSRHAARPSGSPGTTPTSWCCCPGRRMAGVHPRVGVLAARTGRMAYAEPPVQQLPPRVAGCSASTPRPPRWTGQHRAGLLRQHRRGEAPGPDVRGRR